MASRRYHSTLTPLRSLARKPPRPLDLAFYDSESLPKPPDLLFYDSESLPKPLDLVFYDSESFPKPPDLVLYDSASLQASGIDHGILDSRASRGYHSILTPSPDP